MQSEIAVLRFGLGARPGELEKAAGDPRGWLRAQIQGAVTLSASQPLQASHEIFVGFLAAREQRRAANRALADPHSPNKDDLLDSFRNSYVPFYQAQVLTRAQSAATTERPFAERLVHFWTNHFAVSADKGIVTGIAGTLETEAIRPHVCGSFADLLRAVEQHPAMIAFLDNQASFGPSSRAALASRGRDGKRALGINENLAREIMELHTLGVNGGYTQTDVTTFAKVLTGWSIGGARGRLSGGDPGRFFFRENIHEPGAKAVLGVNYRQQGLAQGEAVLGDLARHPATAKFIATKLARHFIADDPAPALVHRLARTFKDSDGYLPDVYAALLNSDEAWDPDQRKFKTPEDLVFSTLRALGALPQTPAEILPSFEFLGQRQYTPGSPAGWPDISKAWDGSDALMHRVLWASRMAEKSASGANATDVANHCLGRYARTETLTALKRATSNSQALSLLIMSPEFQRR